MTLNIERGFRNLALFGKKVKEFIAIMPIPLTEEDSNRNTTNITEGNAQIQEDPE